MPEGNPETGSHGSSDQKRKRRKKTRFSLRKYFQDAKRRRLQKRDARAHARMKKKIKRQHEKKQKKEAKQRSIAQQLFTITEEGELEVTKKKKREFFSKKSSFYRNAVYILNSLVVFIITYIITYLIYWLAEMFMASLYGLDSILYYYDLKFNDFSPLWTRFNILVITGVPPFVSLFIGLLLFRTVFKMKRFNSLQKLFILWWSLHSLNHFFGAFASGVVTNEGFGYVAAWLYLNTAFKFMFTIIALFLLSVFGYFAKQSFLETSNSQHRIQRENQISFIFTQAFIPWLLGTIIILITRIPHNFDYPYESLLMFSLGFPVIAAFFNPKVKPRLNLLKLKKKYRVSISNLVIFVLLMLFYRVVLGIGLHFIIKISISISPANI